LSPAPSTISSEAAQPKPPSRPGTVARWIPVALWAACIWWFSGEAFSAKSTHNYIDPAIRFLFGDLSPAAIRLAHAAIRKTAHFLEYAILAMLLYRAVALPGARTRPSVLAKTVLYCALYASADELHQTFERTRTGSALDVALDATGATTGTLIIAWWRGVRGAAAGKDPRAKAGVSARSRG